MKNPTYHELCMREYTDDEVNERPDMMQHRFMLFNIKSQQSDVKVK